MQPTLPLAGQRYQRPATLPAHQLRPDDQIAHDGLTGIVDRVAVTWVRGVTRVKIWVSDDAGAPKTLTTDGETPIGRIPAPREATVRR